MSNIEYSIEEKNRLKKDIEKLEYNQLCQVYNIISKDTDKISENNNGIFINLKYLNNNTLKKLFNFIDYCQKNKSEEINNDNESIEQKKSLQSDKLSINEEEQNNIFEETLSEEFNIYNNENLNKNSDFIFKNYIEKLSSTNYKEFDEDIEKKTVFKAQNNKIKLNGVKYRLIKKCREINKSNNEIIENIMSENDNENSYDYSNYKFNELSEDV